MNMLHLSEEQMDDVLLGDAAAETTEHLRQCNDCREQLTGMQSAIQNFTTVTMSWSERRSATMPPQAVTEGLAWNRKLNWALAAGVVAVTAIILPIATRNSPNSTKLAATDAGQVTPQQAQTRPTPPIMEETPVANNAVTASTLRKEDVVARDNQMLQAIDAELDASMDSPEQIFGGEIPQGGGSQNHGLPEPVSD